MCGIAGLIRNNPGDIRLDEIQAMTRRMAHRGPDGEGFLLRDHVALGHRRLSIIDLEGGAQPLSNEDGNLWCVFNGEIYNFRALRVELENQGHRFATHSDTEVIVHAYEQWGPACLDRFRGMFALALVDFHERQVLLARDPFGIKPLFYCQGQGVFAWASEINALRHVAGIPLSLNSPAIAQYLWFSSFIAPQTIFEQVFHLPPAHYMMVDFDGRPIHEPRRYWRMAFQEDDSLSESQWLEAVGQCLHESVQAHMVSDVHFGVLLSGGVDSTLVASQMQAVSSVPIQAFTVGFHESEFSEVPYARQAAMRLGLDLRIEIVNANVNDLLGKLIEHHGQPFADSSMIPTWHLCKLAREHVPMVLTGDGGDEMFCGYDRYRFWMRYRPLLAWMHHLRQGKAGSSLNELALGIYELFNPLRARSLKAIKLFTEITSKQRHKLWRKDRLTGFQSHSQTFDETWVHSQNMHALSQVQFNDIECYLPSDILTKVDMASMYHGLETRTPLVDRNVAELAGRIPASLRCRFQTRSQAQTKYLLKQLLQGQFPASFVHRQKMGLSIPQVKWMSQSGSLRNQLEALLLDPQSRIMSLLDPKAIRNQIDLMDQTGAQSEIVWSMLCLGLWLEQNRDIPV